jgi:hypothetical protein
MMQDLSLLCDASDQPHSAIELLGDVASRTRPVWQSKADFPGNYHTRQDSG